MREKLREDLGFGVATEEQCARECLPKYDRRGIDVGLNRCRLVLEELGGKIGKFAFDRAGSGLMRVADGFRYSEIENARDTVATDHHVLRRDVAMNESKELSSCVSAVVCCMQSVKNVEQDGCDHAGWTTVSRLSRATKKLTQRFAGDVLEHEEDFAGVRNDVERGDDVRVLDPCGQAGLVDEAGDERRVTGEVLVESLDGDDLAESGGPEEAPQMNGGHATRGDLAVYRIATSETDILDHCIKVAESVVGSSILVSLSRSWKVESIESVQQRSS